MDDTIDLAGAFAEHERRVYTYFRRMVGDPEVARDLSQETFVRALRGATRYAGEAPVAAWLLGIARRPLGTIGSMGVPVTLPSSLADAEIHVYVGSTAQNALGVIALWSPVALGALVGWLARRRRAVR